VIKGSLLMGKGGISGLGLGRCRELRRQVDAVIRGMIFGVAGSSWNRARTSAATAIEFAAAAFGVGAVVPALRAKKAGSAGGMSGRTRKLGVNTPDEKR
jgi:hypothetical protein